MGSFQPSFVAVFLTVCIARGLCCTNFCKFAAWDLINLSDVDKEYDPKRVIATGLSVSTDKVFITAPRPTEKVPCTLMYFNKTSDCWTSSSNCVTHKPSFACWPSVADNSVDSCDNVINAHAGMRIDKWGRAWIIDSGRVGSETNFKQVCPQRIHVFNLKTGEKLRMYEIPTIESCSIFSYPVNFVVDSAGSSEDTFVYTANMDKLWVYSWKSNSSWEFIHPFFSFDPVKGNFDYGSINYQVEYSGVCGLTLSPAESEGDKTLYFHSLASTREFSVSTSVLRNSSKITNNYFEFTEVGDRGEFGRSLGQVISRKTGTMLFSLVDFNGTACWNPNCPYTPSNFHYLCKGSQFLGDIVIDNNNVAYLLHNELPKIMAGYPPEKDMDNFSIYCGKVDDLVEGTACDPYDGCYEE